MLEHHRAATKGGEAQSCCILRYTSLTTSGLFPNFYTPLDKATLKQDNTGVGRRNKETNTEK